MSANTNPGGVDFNNSPYFDDYDEDKKFARILYVPGRAVQARELTQAQTIQQKQIQRFANYFFNAGSILDGCENNLDYSVSFVKLQPNYNSEEVNVSSFLYSEVIGANTGIKAYVGIVSDIENDDPKTLFVNYTAVGCAVLSVNVASSLLTVGNTLVFPNGGTGVIRAFYTDPISNSAYIYLGQIEGELVAPNTANSILSTGLSNTVNVTSIIDKRYTSIFEENETLFSANVFSRFYANTATERATWYIENEGLATQKIYTKGSKITINDGTLYIADHFVKNSTQTIILDKYSNAPSYKIGLVPEKTIIDNIDDTTLLDNAAGTPNFQAPGADRLKIDTVLTKVPYGETTDDNEFITIMEIERGVVKKRKISGLESKMADAIAKRTFEESGNYTLSDPKVFIREHLDLGTNNGRYSEADGGSNDLLSVEVDPFVSYVAGYRNEFIVKQDVALSKGTDTELVEQIKIPANYGNYVEVNEVVGAWDFMEATSVDLYNAPQKAVTKTLYSNTSTNGTKIGTAKVRSIDYASGTVGTASGKYYLYLFDVVMNSGNNFVDVRSIYDSATPNRYADIVLDSNGRAVIQDQSFDKLIFELPYEATETIRDANGNVESGFRFKKEFSVTFNSGVATITSTDSSETFVGTGALSTTQKNENYFVIVTNSSANAETSSLGTGTVAAASSMITTTGSFAARLNVDDFIKINSQILQVSSVNTTHIVTKTTHTAGATSNTITKIIPPGYYFNLNGNGGSAATRTVTVSSPGTISIDVKEPATFTARVVATMDRANAREMLKILNYQATANINPSTHTNGFSGPYSLGKADAYRLHAIYESGSFSANATTSDTNVTSNYDFDNGQRDNSYEHATIKPKLGIVPAGRLLAVFDHFTHDISQGVGYLSVDSYPVNDTTTSNTTILTTNIPKYTSPRTGITYNLRDCIDFRPIKTAASSTLNPVDPGTYQTPTGGIHFPKVDEDFEADASFYKSRISRLYIDEEGNLGINSGQSKRFKPTPPPTLPNTMDLVEFIIPPYPSTPSTVVTRLLKNKRYTMKDVGRIEARVEKLEYYTSLNLLERIAAEKSVIDEEGIDRFKNGILVDPFIGYSVADVTLPTYKAAINREEKYATAYANNENQVKLVFNSTSSSGVTKTPGNKLMLNYTTENFINQPFASQSLNCAQELSFNWTGTMEVYPPSDNWMDTVRDTSKTLVIDNSGELDNWKALSDAWNTVVSPLNKNWVGLPPLVTTESFTESSTSNFVEQRGNIVVNRAVTSSEIVTRQVTTQRSDEFIQKSEVTSGALQTQSADRVVDVSISHHMRPRDFVFKATGMKPGARLYAFFDGIDVTQYCQQIKLLGNYTIQNLSEQVDNNGKILSAANNVYYTQLSSGLLRTNENYEIVGIFSVPSKKFNVGLREFKVTASNTNIENTGTTTFAKTAIQSSGLTQTKSETVVNTRPSNINFNNPNLREIVGQRASGPSSVEIERRRVSDVTNETLIATIPPPANTTNVVNNNTVNNTTIVNAAQQTTTREALERFAEQRAAAERENQRILAALRETQAIERERARAARAAGTAATQNDPLSQSFYVDEFSYPDGVYVTSIDLFFRTKSSDPNLGVSVAIREMSNGFPTRKTIGNEISRKTSSQISISEDASSATTFTFVNPIYLLPGQEYCFLVMPEGNSTDFELWVAELGKIDITNPSLNTRIDKNNALTAGVLFTSSNDSTWTPRQNLDIKFVMKNAVFDTESTGTAIFNNIGVSDNFGYLAVQPIIEDLTPNFTAITYQIKTISSAYVADSYTLFKNLDRIEYGSKRYIANTTNETAQTLKSLTINASMSTASRYITPYIDLTRGNAAFEDYVINSSTSNTATGTVTYSASSNVVVGSGTSFNTEISPGQYVYFGNDQYRFIANVANATYMIVATPFIEANSESQTITYNNEENPSGPYISSSRYISRRVALNDGFEASDLVVYLDVNRPGGSDVKVYYKILNENDVDSFDDKFYYEMEISGAKTFTDNPKKYVEEKYVVPTSIKTGGTYLLTGNVIISTSNTDVIGNGTRFTEDLRIGDTVAVGEDRTQRVVSNIVNNTFLTVESAFTSTAATQDIFKVLNNSIQYTTPDNRVFSGFKYFAIKIVFLSSSDSSIPRTKNLRALALA
jgi:hypothetical protein